MTTTNEHIATLFIVAVFYWLNDQDEAANVCLETAVQVSHMISGLVGDA